MPLQDIKDAGVLAGFRRWGWPYHGLASTVGGNTTIAGSGKLIENIYNGHAWLIDIDMPMVDITPAEVISEAAEHREWLTYANISGGVVYGKQLPMRAAFGRLSPSAFIHIDAAGVPWLINLETIGWPSVNHVRLYFEVIRFGDFRQANPPMPISRSATVICTAIEPTGLFSIVNKSYLAREVLLFDVHTNGSKALFGVCGEYGAPYYGTSGYIDVLSLLELKISGVGGADGSGLEFALDEAVGQPGLTTFGPNTGPTNLEPGSEMFLGNVYSGVQTPSGGSTYEEGCRIWSASQDSAEILWVGHVNSTAVECGVVWQFCNCRYATYDADGHIQAWRIRYRRTVDHSIAAIEDSGLLGGPACSADDPALTHTISVSIVGEVREGYTILNNDSEIDKVEHVIAYAGTQLQTYVCAFGVPCSFTVTNPTPYASTGETWEGSLSAALPAGTGWPDTGANRWIMFSFADARAVNLNTPQALPDGTKVGIYRTTNAAAFYVGDPSRIYGNVCTQVGVQSTTLTGNFYFAWQRKTGDSAILPNPCCYV